MTTPNFENLLPITYTGVFEGQGGDATFTVKGKNVTRPECPFTGQVLVQITSGSRTPINGLANGGGYKFSRLADATGREYSWRTVFVVVVRGWNPVQVYPYIPTNIAVPDDKFTPVAMTFTPLGEHQK